MGQSYYETEDGKICMDCLPDYARKYFLADLRTAMAERARLCPLRSWRRITARPPRPSVCGLRQLRQAKKQTQDREELFWIARRTAVLTTMLHELNELSELLEHYYRRGILPQ